jgi:hypothetical protein
MYIFNFNIYAFFHKLARIDTNFDFWWYWELNLGPQALSQLRYTLGHFAFSLFF